MDTPFCRSVLYHGKLSTPCLAELNISEAKLPCVRNLFVTAFPGSGTLFTATQLRKLNYLVAHESHHLEELELKPDVLVSWYSRTDVWRLPRFVRGPNVTAGIAHDPHWRKAYHVGGHRKIDGVLLNRCLYRRVLLQTREPLATIRSCLQMSVAAMEYDVLADQLLARGLALAGNTSACLPVRPRKVRCDLRSTSSRRSLVAYLLCRWILWMEAALLAADWHFAIEDVGSDPVHLCTLLGLHGLPAPFLNANLPAGSRVRAGAACQIPGAVAPARVQAGQHRHSTHEQVVPLTWAEACEAHEEAARRAFALARSLGYRYGQRQTLSCER